MNYSGLNSVTYPFKRLKYIFVLLLPGVLPLAYLWLVNWVYLLAGYSARLVETKGFDMEVTVVICAVQVLYVYLALNRYFHLKTVMGFEPDAIIFLDARYSVPQTNEMPVIETFNAKYTIKNKRKIIRHMIRIGNNEIDCANNQFAVFVCGTCYFNGELSGNEKMSRRYSKYYFSPGRIFFGIVVLFYLAVVILQMVMTIFGDGPTVINNDNGAFAVLLYIWLTTRHRVFPVTRVLIFKNRLFVSTRSGRSFVQDIRTWHADELPGVIFAELSARDNRRITRLTRKYLKRCERILEFG